MVSDTVDTITRTLPPTLCRAVPPERRMQSANPRHKSVGLGQESKLVPHEHEAIALPTQPLGVEVGGKLFLNNENNNTHKFKDCGLHQMFP